MKKNYFNLYNIICLIIGYLVFTGAGILFAVDDDVKKLIYEAGGISEEDVIEASRKKELSLFDVYALSVKNTERMAIQGENSIQSDARRLQAFGAFLPKVSLKANKYLPKSTGTTISPAQRSTVSLYARQPIMTGLDEWSNFKLSNSDVKIQKLLTRYNAELLLLDISSAFYDFIRIEKSLKNNIEILNLYNSTGNELKRRVAIGRSRQSEVLRTNSGMYKLEAEIKALHNDLAHARLALKTISGITDDMNLTEGEDLPDPDYNITRTNLKDLIAKRWDVRASMESLERARSGVLAAYGGFLPSAYLDATYYLYQERSSGMAAGTKMGNYYFSLGAELPIFSGGITAARVKEAESIKRQSELGLSNTMRLAEQDVMDAYQSWESLKKEKEAFLKALTSAEENYKILKDEYRLNLVTILDVLTSLQSLQSARDDYERTSLQLKLVRIRLGTSTNEFSGSNRAILKRLTAINGTR